MKTKKQEGKLKILNTNYRFYDDINQTQIETLNKFKEKLLKENTLSDFSYFDDLYLLRFLRARKFDIEKTNLMFITFLKWRQNNGVEDIENFDFNEILSVKKIYPHGYHKTDKQGRPIYIELLSKVNIPELFKLTTEERFMKYYIKEYERLMKYRFPSCSQKADRIIEQSLTILDVEGLGITSLTGKTKEFVKISADIAQNYYPEMLGQMFLINASFFFSAIWTLVKGFLDEKTRNKITVEKSYYQKKLLELVDTENLPLFLGGSCTCPDIEGGCLHGDIGPWNPNGGLGYYNFF